MIHLSHTGLCYSPADSQLASYDIKGEKNTRKENYRGTIMYVCHVSSVALAQR